ncbi:hypothetical protein WJX84_009952 [Apatococcus fuscideae]|uniref:Uncharacterized protein n=1 Tax=Apatococcus fuscideae TaxID=2026836 RepID=A0AAW1SW33_9CHLO
MEVNSSGTVTAKAMGKNGLIGDTSAAAQLTLKRQVQNALCEIKLTDASIRGQPFQDVLAKATTKPRKDVKVAATYDLSRSKFTFSPAYTFVARGRTSTASALWKEAGNQLSFELATVLSKTEKLNAVYTTRNKSLLTEYSWSSGVWTVAPLAYLAPPQGAQSRWVGTAGVTATRRLPQKQLGLTALKAIYDLGSESASLAVEGGPGWKAAMKVPLGRSKGVAHPTLAFTYSATYLLDTSIGRAGSKPSAASKPTPAASQAPAGGAPASAKSEPAARAPTPGEQLVLKNIPLDTAFEQNMVKDERGVYTWSTQRK